MTDRRSFISGILITCGAPAIVRAIPAIVRAESLMVVKKRTWEPGIYHDGRLLFHAAPGLLPALEKQYNVPRVDGSFWLKGEVGSRLCERMLGAPPEAFFLPWKPEAIPH